MAKCMECGKKLGILEGHHHSLFRKKWLFCSKCYDKIEKKGSKYLKKLEKEGRL